VCVSYPGVAGGQVSREEQRVQDKEEGAESSLPERGGRGEERRERSKRRRRRGGRGEERREKGGERRLN